VGTQGFGHIVVHIRKSWVTLSSAGCLPCRLHIVRTYYSFPLLWLCALVGQCIVILFLFLFFLFFILFYFFFFFFWVLGMIVGCGPSQIRQLCELAHSRSVLRRESGSVLDRTREFGTGSALRFSVPGSAFIHICMYVCTYSTYICTWGCCLLCMVYMCC
jgi:hypothetical protein